MSDNSDTKNYYIPEGSPWPVLTALTLCVLAVGAATTVQQTADGVSQQAGNWGLWVLLSGFVLLVFMMVRWFGDTIKESLAKKNSSQMDISYRMGMLWFIFSEVMFFAAFFGALFYVRLLSIPWLGGEGAGGSTHEFLWPDFEAAWPLLLTPAGEALNAVHAWGIPAFNTALLLASSVTLTIAHHALVDGNRKTLKTYLLWTLILGFVFLGFQVYEYYLAYTELGLTLGSGIYGSTFFLLTGFHGLHVTIGATILAVMYFRVLRGHLTPDNHFAFEAAAWYWHFVDVVWLFLFVCVYWL